MFTQKQYLKSVTWVPENSANFLLSIVGYQKSAPETGASVISLRQVPLT